MKTPVFGRVVVPIEFDTVADREIHVDHSYELGANTWVTTGPATMQALGLAAQLAREEIILVHATPDLTRSVLCTGMGDGGLPAGALFDLEAAGRKATEKVLEQICRKWFDGVKASTAVATGRPLDVITGAVEERNADAVVMAASARGRVRRAMVGSTADRVVRHANCPVLIVPSPA